MSTAVKLENISKSFSIEIARPSTFAALKRIVNSNGHFTRNFQALKNINLEVLGAGEERDVKVYDFVKENIELL